MAKKHAFGGKTVKMYQTFYNKELTFIKIASYVDAVGKFLERFNKKGKMMYSNQFLISNYPINFSYI